MGSSHRKPVSWRRWAIIPILAGGVAASLAQADTLLIWDSGTPVSEADSWASRAEGARPWTVERASTDEADIKRAVTSGKLPRSLSTPRDATDLVLLGRAL